MWISGKTACFTFGIVKLYKGKSTEVIVKKPFQKPKVITACVQKSLAIMMVIILIKSVMFPLNYGNL